MTGVQTCALPIWDALRFGLVVARPGKRYEVVVVVVSKQQVADHFGAKLVIGAKLGTKQYSGFLGNRQSQFPGFGILLPQRVFRFSEPVRNEGQHETDLYDLWTASRIRGIFLEVRQF